ncbi:hypothetical protein, partial [Microcoleus sp. herbarium12]|uniref:hypothetical protein n=1 Tax=Microcoleus sp. herbarium12 TaxID=3055437 RepID=UPI003B0C2150
MNPLNPEVSMQELQARVAQLEHENAALRSSENRDRLLEATATAAKALLTIENLDEAVNSALQIIGECLDCDRVTVIDHFDDPSQPLPCWRILYERDSPHTVSQISHSQAAQGTYQGIQDWTQKNPRCLSNGTRTRSRFRSRFASHLRTTRIIILSAVAISSRVRSLLNIFGLSQRRNHCSFTRNSRSTQRTMAARSRPSDLAFKQHIRDRAPVIYDLEDHPESTPIQHRFMQRLGVKMLLGIPLLLGSEIVGSLTESIQDTSPRIHPWRNK